MHENNIIYIRWPEGYQYDDILKQLVEESAELLEASGVHWGTEWDPAWCNGAGHWTLEFRGEEDETPVELEYGKGVKIESGHASPVERIGWRGKDIVRIEQNTNRKEH